MLMENKRLIRDSMIKAFLKTDESGMTLERIIEDFFEFLEKLGEHQERMDYLNALKSIESGQYMTAEVEKEFWEEGGTGERTEKSMANVRLVNGETKSEQRKNLMLTFNTPFFPEILIASSVMAEGVDLHLNCRYVIHHDLCWNPSTLEQRTGRIDRIGAKAERCGKSIYIYLPYIEETQDEKMYRVVMDRERWFKVVMGEKFRVDACTTDKIAERIPMPKNLADDLAFRLEVE
jgi:superfamily II DNA/RNA helicase